MGLFDRIFKRKPRVADWADVPDLLERHAAFIVNRTMYEYARARSGVFSTDLLKEKTFQAAVEKGRWRAFPVALADVAEVAQGMARRAGEDCEVEAVAAISAAADVVLTRFSVPEGEAPEFWTEARESVRQRLAHASIAAPKPIKDVPIATFSKIFDNVPLHEIVRQHDYEVVQNSLRGMLLNAADKLAAEANWSALVAKLPRSPEPTA